jgi:glutathione S-transferase
MLEELGCPYALSLIDIRAGEGKNPQYRKLNPHGKVPTLVHNGAVVPDSTAILLYLADAFPDARLAPALTDARRGPYLAWMTYTAAVIEPAFAARRNAWSYDPRSVSWGAYDDVVQHLREGAGQANPYLLGEDFTAADILIGGAIQYGTQFGLLAADPVFEPYVARLISRPAYKQALAKDAAAETASDTLKEARVGPSRGNP